MSPINAALVLLRSLPGPLDWAVLETLAPEYDLIIRAAQLIGASAGLEPAKKKPS